MIVYKELIYDEEAILNLYLDNEWTAYTNKKELLFAGIKNSLDLIGAYDNDILVGLIRTVGDLQTIIYIQDILVLKSYHRKKIGTKLMQIIIDKYPHVRQICLMTGQSNEQKLFYESLGFISYNDGEVVGFMIKK
jgi:ribosomal protein S18 acetylase RimI-like enzyme